MYVPALSEGSTLTSKQLSEALERFVSLGSPHGNKGLTRVAYLSKPCLGEEILVDAPVHVSGYCTYSFLTSKTNHTVGFLIESPTDITVVEPFFVSVGKRSEEFKVRNDLLPQGVSMFESVEGFAVFATAAVKSPLLVVAE